MEVAVAEDLEGQLASDREGTVREVREVREGSPDREAGTSLVEELGHKAFLDILGSHLGHLGHQVRLEIRPEDRSAGCMGGTEDMDRGKVRLVRKVIADRAEAGWEERLVAAEDGQPIFDAAC